MTNILTKLKLTAAVLIAGLIISAPVLAYQNVGAQIPEESKSAACSGITGASDVSCEPAQSERTVRSLLSTAINLLSWVVGIVAIIMIIIGGFKFVTSNGDANAVTSARNTIIYALVGVVIVVFAQLLVRFVLKESTEAVNQAQ